MARDEDDIRRLVATWMEATKNGDAETVLSLIADDAVFLVPGRPPMRKADFAAAAEAQASGNAPKFEGTSEIQEIKVLGDWAFMWSKLTVVGTPADGQKFKRSGHTLSILRKENGTWVWARDANLLTDDAE